MESAGREPLIVGRFRPNSGVTLLYKLLFLKLVPGTFPLFSSSFFFFFQCIGGGSGTATAPIPTDFPSRVNVVIRSSPTCAIVGYPP